MALGSIVFNIFQLPHLNYLRESVYEPFTEKTVLEAEKQMVSQTFHCFPRVELRNRDV